MDNDKRPPVGVEPGPVALQPPAGPTQTQTVPQQAKPDLAIPDNAAIDLLTINNLQAAPHSSRKFPTKIIIILVGLVLLVVAASMAPGLLKSKQPANIGGQINTSDQHQSNTGTSDDTSKQIDQDVRSCTDPVNAVTSC